MFSGLSKELSVALREEIFGCMKYIHFEYEDLMVMPTKDRKFFIKKHNEVINEENSKHNTGTLSGADINAVADMAMQRGRKE